MEAKNWFKPIKQAPGWLDTHQVADLSYIDTQPVQRRREVTRDLGARPLWKGYKDVADYPRATTGNRSSEEVGTWTQDGRLYAWMAWARKSDIVVEFGSAFGVSGMYWLTGLEAANHGHLFSFEPNTEWAQIAEDNFNAISTGRHTLQRGIFEELGPKTLKPGTVDIAFIDAIHTSEFVNAQFDILRPLMRAGGLILFDDISFSKDMKQCWAQMAKRADIKASGQIGRRVGIVELP